MLSLRLLVFALILQTATAEKENTKNHNPSSQKNSTNCGFGESIINNPDQEWFIDDFLNRTLTQKIHLAKFKENVLKAKMHKLVCLMGVWNTTSDDFSKAIEKVKSSLDLKDWQIQVLDEAGKSYRGDKLEADDPLPQSNSTSSSTSSPDVTTSDWTKSCNEPNLQVRIIQNRCIEQELTIALSEIEEESGLHHFLHGQEGLINTIEKWDTPAADFKTIIERLKTDCCRGNTAWQARVLNEAYINYENEYNGRHSIANSTTIKITTTTAKTMPIGRLPSKNRVNYASCSNSDNVCFYDRKCTSNPAPDGITDMVPIVHVTADKSNCAIIMIKKEDSPDERYLEFQTPYDSVLSVDWEGHKIQYDPRNEGKGITMTCAPLCKVIESYPAFSRSENSGLCVKRGTIALLKNETVATRRPTAHTGPTKKKKAAESQNISLGSIILYSALGLLGLIIIAIVAILLFQRHTRKRAARIHQNLVKGRSSGSNAALSRERVQSSAECVPLMVSTPKAPTPPDQESKSERKSKKSSPSEVDAHSVSQAQSSNERVREVRRGKSSPAHTQITQSNSTRHDSTQSQMFPLRLLVFALILHIVTSEKEEQETGDLSSWEPSTNCPSFINPHWKAHIDIDLSNIVQYKEQYPTEDAIKTQIRKLFCSMVVWNISPDDFSKAIEKAKLLPDVMDWQIKLFDAADKSWRRRNEAKSLSTTSPSTTTTADWAKSCNGPSLSAELQKRCNGAPQADAMECRNVVLPSKPISKEYIGRFLNTVLLDPSNENEGSLTGKIKELECLMNFSGTSSEDFSEVIEQVKNSQELKDWQKNLLDEAAKRWRRRNEEKSLSTTSTPTTTTADWAKSCNGPSLSAELQKRCIEHDLKIALEKESGFEDDLSENMDDLIKKMKKWGADNNHRRAALHNIDREYRDYYNKKHHIIVTTTTTTTQAPGPPQDKERIPVSSCWKTGAACFYDRYCAENGMASEYKIDMQPYANETVDTSKCPFVSIRRNPRPDAQEERFAVFQTQFDSTIRVLWNERTLEFLPKGDEIRCRPFCVVVRSHQKLTREKNSGMQFKQATIALLKIQTVTTRRPTTKTAPTQKPKSEESRIGSIILYSALGLLGLIILAIAAILLFQCHNRRRAARIRKNIFKGQNVSKRPSASSSSNRGSGDEAPDSGASLARASAESSPLLVSTPNAPTPQDQEAERKSKRSVTKSLLTSPSVSRAHTLHTQLTQSTSEHQEVDAS